MLFEKVKRILTRPKESWAEIAAEETDIKGLFAKYALLLSLIPHVSIMVGCSVVGVRFGPNYSWYPITNSLIAAILLYFLNVVGVYINGYLINFFGFYFSADSNLKNAMKLSVYSTTAFWIAGIFNLLPSIRFMTVIVGFYSVYLLYSGLPILIKTPPEKITSFTLSVIVVSLALVFFYYSIMHQVVFAQMEAEMMTY